MDIKTLFAFTCVINVVLGYNSPVLLWGANSVTKPSLGTVSQNTFADIIAPLLKNHMIVVFDEELLSTNDFLCSNAQTTQSCFAFLSGVKQKTYFSSVNNPIEAVRSLVDEKNLKIIRSSESKSLSCAPGNVAIVHFDEPEKERGSLLESHDVSIKKINTNLESCPVIFIYASTTSFSSSLVLNRKIRSTDEATGAKYFRETNQFLLYYTDLLYTNSIHNNGNPQSISLTDSIIVQNTSANILNITMMDSNNKELKFAIVLSGGYYSLTGVTYDNLNFYSNNVNAPTTFSYYCGNLTLTAGSSTDNPVTASLKWNSFQFQAPFDSTYSTTFSFGDPWYCVGFFTPGILMGLFVVILLLAITFTGIAWMMDVNTMDRFDDPKGKTITVNAAE